MNHNTTTINMHIHIYIYIYIYNYYLRVIHLFTIVHLSECSWQTALYSSTSFRSPISENTTPS